tara:strand:- start:1810 stop:2223 length:414 start_codon:yes stop_codon:yes gene_type:complete
MPEWETWTYNDLEEGELIMIIPQDYRPGKSFKAGKTSSGWYNYTHPKTSDDRWDYSTQLYFGTIGVYVGKRRFEVAARQMRGAIGKKSHKRGINRMSVRRPTILIEGQQYIVAPSCIVPVGMVPVEDLIMRDDSAAT